jgi:hypothetical protein
MMDLPRLLLAAAFALLIPEARSQGIVVPSLPGAQWNGFAVIAANPPRGADGRPLYCVDPKATVERGKCHVVDWVGRDTGNALSMSDAEFMDRQIRSAARIPDGSTYEIVGIGPNFVGGYGKTAAQIKISTETVIAYIRVYPIKK